MSQPPSPVPQRSTPLGTAAATTAVVAWGLGNTIVASVPLPGTVISFYRLLAGFLLYVSVLYVRGGRLTLRSLRHGWQGGLAFGLNVASFFVALRLTSVANATTIGALQPLLLMGFAAVMFSERIRTRHVICGMFATGGVAMVAFGAGAESPSDLVGDALAVVALVTMSWYFVASKSARRHLDTLEYMTVAIGVAFVVVTPLALATGDLLSQGLPGPRAALGIAAIVAIPGSGHLLMNWAHNHTTLLLSSLVTLAIPVVSTASAALFLGQVVTAVQVMGIALVLASLAVVIAADARQVPAVKVS